MSFLLDTNVVSEVCKDKPNENVANWLIKSPMDRNYISSLTIGEIRKGVSLLGEGRRKQKITTFIEYDLPNIFGDRVLSVDLKVADKWGYLMGRYKEKGKILPVIDGLISATALVYNLTIVTRNIKDFQIDGLEVLNPWIK